MEYTKGKWEERPMGTIIQIVSKGSSKKYPEMEVYICEVANPSEVANRKDYQEEVDNAHLITSAPAMYEALQRIMMMDTSSALDAMAYTGGDVPKKWLREEAPAIDARANARKEIQAIIRPILAKAEGNDGVH